MAEVFKIHKERDPNSPEHLDKLIHNAMKVKADMAMRVGQHSELAKEFYGPFSKLVLTTEQARIDRAQRAPAEIAHELSAAIEEATEAIPLIDQRIIDMRKRELEKELGRPANDN